MTSKPISLINELGNTPAYRALEPRIAFDAALAATVDQAVGHSNAEAPTDSAAHAPTDALTQSAVRGLAEAISEQPAAISNDVDQNRAPLDVRATLDSIADHIANASPTASNIVFIDSAVQNAAIIAAAAPAGAEIVMLDAASDGLTQIALHLSGRTDIGAIHIVSHGEAGELNLGNSNIDRRQHRRQPCRRARHHKSRDVR